MQVKSNNTLCILLACGLATYAMGIDKFRAAVYEHDVIYNGDRSTAVTRQEALAVMMQNLQVYREQATMASKMGAKILVFPEYGLYGLNWTRESIQPYLEYIPDTRYNDTIWNPCEAPTVYPNTEVQRNLSCIAKTASIYMVANMGARQPCEKSDPNCPPDMYYQFSANVVYRPNGDFIARYFKYNLYSMEKHFDKPQTPDITTFDTPFGRFGTFTSADILFHYPSIALIRKMNVTNIAYPTAWQDELPLMAAIEFHSAYAEGMLINLLVANLHLPSQGYHGSGLYWPTGTSVNASYYYNSKVNSKGFLVVEDMTPFVIPPGNDRLNSPFRKPDFRKRSGTGAGHDADKVVDLLTETKHAVNITINHDVYTAILLEESWGELKVCQGKLCCSAGYEGTFDQHEVYAIGAFDGVHTQGTTYHLQACVFIKCANASRESCGAPTTTSSSYMSKMSFTGTFTTDYVYPEVLTDQDNAPGLVTSIWYYQEAIIIDAGLYGGPLSISMIARDFSRDPQTIT